MDTIGFNIGGGGAQTIQPLATLPIITDSVIIDGSTQPGFAGSPLIELDGTNAGTIVLQINAGGSTVNGLTISNAAGTAISLVGGTGNVISNVDVSWSGTGQSGTGVALVTSSGNTIQNVTANNRNAGVSFVGTSTDNMIVDSTLFGNGFGVLFSSSDNRVECSSILNNSVGVAVSPAVSGIVLTDNHIAGNSTAGVSNSSTAVVNAENNFWGAADGPSPLGGSGDSYTGNVDADPFLTSLPPCLVDVQEVLIDVKPDSENDVANLAANGVLPVVIFTTADFDAATVDVSTVTFGGADAVLSTLEDVDGDGDLDLVLHFLIAEMVELEADYVDALLADLADGFLNDNHQNVLVTLKGHTLDGTAIQGADTIDAFFAGKALQDALV